MFLQRFECYSKNFNIHIYYILHTRICFSCLLMYGKWSICDQVWNRIGWLTSSIIVILKFLRIPQEQQKHFICIYYFIFSKDFPTPWLLRQRSRFLSPFYRWINRFSKNETDLLQVREGQWQSLVWNPHWLRSSPGRCASKALSLPEPPLSPHLPLQWTQRGPLPFGCHRASFQSRGVCNWSCVLSH